MLILVDVLLLLLSFIHTQGFRKIIRDSGFVITTVLLKLSFSAEGFLNSLLIVVAVLFGVAILWIHNLYQRLELRQERSLRGRTGLGKSGNGPEED